MAGTWFALLHFECIHATAQQIIHASICVIKAIIASAAKELQCFSHHKIYSCCIINKKKTLVRIEKVIDEEYF